ncbi:hypothetical protein EVC10_057 [Rhizobium phage RHph_Y25]|nr:hypothetical protein EVC10_057 [Rhizobium phage RHph_Y25]
MGEWIEWKGGECPVEPRMLVHVLFQKMPHEPEPVQSSRPQKAKSLWWDHRFNDGVPDAGNIVAYRIITNPDSAPPHP